MRTGQGKTPFPRHIGTSSRYQRNLSEPHLRSWFLSEQPVCRTDRLPLSVAALHVARIV